MGSSGASGGWALTGHGLELTADAGLTWTDVTPAGLAPAAIEGVGFAGPAGWVITVDGGGMALDLRQTSDSGKSWTEQVLPGTYADGVGHVWVDALSDQAAWISVRLPTSAAESFGTGLRTADGGKSWEPVDLPVAGPVSFDHSSNGFLAGGTVGQSLYRTSDGGATWKAITVPAPKDYGDHSPTFEVPSLFGTEEVLPVNWNQPNGGPLIVAFYVSGDTGVTWQQATTIDAGPDGSATPVGVLSSSQWVAVTSTGLVESVDGGKTIGPVVATGLDATAVEKLVPVGTSLWAVSHSGSCDATKTSCSSGTWLSISGDGGMTWSNAKP